MARLCRWINGPGYGMLSGGREARQLPGQPVEGRQAQTEGFDGFSAGEFLKQLIQLSDIGANTSLQSPLIQVQTKQNTG